MSYSFQPMSDAEIDALNLIEDGEYEFQVVKSTRRVSKKGNPMAEIQLNIWDKKGTIRTVFDYLVFSTVGLNIRKIKHFCESVGLIEEYKQGNLREDLSNLCGKVLIGTQEPQPNPNGGMYEKKNVVIDYLSGDIETNKTPIKKSDSDLNDDLPF